jgi:hypothetical protein
MAMLIGNNIALVVYFFYGVLLMNQIDSLGYHFSDLLNLLIQTVLSTLIVLMTAEFYQKFFSNLCQWFNQIFCFASLCFYLLFYFISSFLISVSDFVLKNSLERMGIRYSFILVKSSLKLHYGMSSVEDDDEVDSEIQMFQNALEFSG